MHDYPPEYDMPCVLSIDAPNLPDWLDPAIYWDEDGCVFVQRKDDGVRIVLFDEFEATDNEEADRAAIKQQAIARLEARDY